MRVVHVYKDVFPPVTGGIEKHIDLIRRALPDVHTDVLICARSRTGWRQAHDAGVEIKVAELGPRPWSVPISPAFPATLRRLSADLVHVHMPNPLGELAALMDHRRPLVCSYHADIVRQARLAPAYRPLLHACFRRANEIIVGSRRLAQSSPFLGSYGRTATVMPYFVDTDRLDPSQVGNGELETLRARYPGPVVLTVARLVYYKGLDVLIDTARSLQATVLIVGDGPLAGPLREMARGLTNVEFVGEVSERDLLRYFALADCFVLPSTSRAESFGMAVLEAQAMAVPAVVTDVGTGTVEAIAPDETGLVVSPSDPAALSDAIRRLLADPAHRHAMGQRARERTVKLHSMQAAAAQLREIYARALREAPKRAASSEV